MSNFFKIQTQSIDLQIKDNDGNDVGLTLTVLPPDHPKAKAGQRKFEQKLQENARRGKNADMFEIGREKSAACVGGWTFSSSPQFNGVPIEPVPYSEEACSALLADPVFAIILEQLNQALEEKSRFFKKPN